MSPALEAEEYERRGLERAALLDADAAMDAFAEAEALWSRLGATDGVCRTWVHVATLHLRGFGNLREAGIWLEQARHARGKPGSNAWARATLARADLLFLRGNAGRAAALVDVVIGALEGARPDALAGAAVQGIAVTRGSAQDRYVRLLCAQLARVAPPARLGLVDRLDICPPLSGEPELRVRLRELVPSPVCAPRTYPPGDRGHLVLRDAELERVLGRYDEALLKLEHAWRKLGDSGPAHALAAATARAGARRLAAELAERAPAQTMADGVALVRLAGVLDDPGMRARALHAATRVLQGQDAGVWSARLLELRARDAVSAEHALELRRHAAGVYEALGDDARRDRALGRAPRPSAAPPAPVAEHELCVVARLRGGRLTLRVNDHAGRSGRLCHLAALERVREAIAAPSHDPEALGRDLAAILRAAVATVHVERDDRVAALSAGAAALEARPRVTQVTRDVGLDAGQPTVQALPWELAVPALDAAGIKFFRRTRTGTADMRGIQGALRRLDPWPLATDGNLGPETALARGVPSPLVILDTPGERLRNVFASLLAHAGTVRAILATAHSEHVTTALQAGGEIAAVTAAIRTQGDALTALFARTPSLRFPAPTTL